MDDKLHLLLKYYIKLRKNGFKYFAKDKRGQIVFYKEKPFKDREKREWRHTKAQIKEHGRLATQWVDCSLRTLITKETKVSWLDKEPRGVVELFKVYEHLSYQQKEFEKEIIGSLAEGDVVYRYSPDKLVLNKSNKITKVVVDKIIRNREEVVFIKIADEYFTKDGVLENKPHIILRPCNKTTDREYKEYVNLRRARQLIKNRNGAFSPEEAFNILKALEK